jgi:precorrin-4 methylase
MRVVSDLKELMEVVYGCDVVLVVISRTGVPEARVLQKTLRRIEEKSRGLVTAVMFLSGELKNDTVTISLFFKGVEVVRQDGIFGNEKKDYEALKWTISSVLNSRGVETPF